MTFSVKSATLHDLESLVKLERACFADPWSSKHFEAELEGNKFSRIFLVPHPNIKPGSHEIIGYICAWLIFEEVRFLNLAVIPEFRRQGMAKRLIRGVLNLANEEHCQRGLLEVRESNLAAINLYKSLNFKEYARRKSYYTNPGEDAILMRVEPLSKTQYQREKEGRFP